MLVYAVLVNYPPGEEYRQCRRESLASDAAIFQKANAQQWTFINWYDDDDDDEKWQLKAVIAQWFKLLDVREFEI